MELNKGLNQLRDEIHAIAVSRGFYQVDEEINQIGVDNRTAIKHALFAQKIALIHSELSEALEADRLNVNETSVQKLENIAAKSDIDFTILYRKFVKGTVSEELADVVIRVLDLCGHLRIDIERHVNLKIRYNETMEYKHEKNY